MARYFHDNHQYGFIIHALNTDDTTFYTLTSKSSGQIVAKDTSKLIPTHVFRRAQADEVLPFAEDESTPASTDGATLTKAKAEGRI